MFTRLKVQGYRCLADVDLELRPLNVFIGANGSGKSSVLDLFELLSRAARAELSKALTERGGLQALLTSLHDARASELVLTLGWAEEDTDRARSRSYEVALHAFSHIGHGVERESVDGVAQPHVRSALAAMQRRALARMSGIESREPFDVPRRELTLAAEGKLEPLRATLADLAHCGVIDTRARAPIKWPQDLEPAQLLPGPDAETLVSALYNLRTDHADVFDRIVDTLRAAFSDFEGLDFPLAAAGKATFVWKASRFDGATRGLYPHQLSDGMLRFLWLATLLLSPQLPPLVTLDEPEVSLHPQLLMLLAGLLREASLRSQLLVATHSPELIRWLEPGEVVVLDLEDGIAQARRGDDPTLDIDAWLKDYTLGQLWVMGQLGGRT